MARKNLFGSLMGSPEANALERPISEARAEYARRGASRSMIHTLDELAENSMLVAEGHIIVELDPDLLDPSPFADRVGEDPEEFEALLGAIRESEQRSPILVRPHPTDAQRYVIVYGHRRTKVAKALGKRVRSIVKPLEEIAHVIAQGQENSARADLSFIEKALFARKLLEAGIEKSDVKKALTTDDTLLSRMLGVVDNVPKQVLEALGAAKGIGRDRWESLKKVLMHPDQAASAVALVSTDAFAGLALDQRFSAILENAQKASSRKKAKVQAEDRTWSLAQSSVKVATKDTGRSFTMALKARDASAFGAYLSQNLERLYEEFQRGKGEPTG